MQESTRNVHYIQHAKSGLTNSLSTQCGTTLRTVIEIGLVSPLGCYWGITLGPVGFVCSSSEQYVRTRCIVGVSKWYFVGGQGKNNK